MASLVSELQRKAKDPNFPVSDLLWDAKRVAKRLTYAEFDEWLNNELNGYTTLEIPDYRKVDVKVVCKMKSSEPWRHLDPRGKLDDVFSPMKLDQPIGEISACLDNEKCYFKVPSNSLNILHDNFSEYMFMFEVNPIQIKRAVNNVRNKILDLALELESEGILTDEIILAEKETKIPEEKSHPSSIITHEDMHNSENDIVITNNSNNPKIAIGNSTKINSDKSKEYPRLNIFLAVIGLIIGTAGVYLTYLQYLK
ncbi:AbiTii domain-containing protein [Methanococcus maripaludis]|uniref:AbiTii domain-containing protein n=1 Tax=Methanococcus maripaludis TaxID=39152 RepID=A0A7J9PNV8_METMI|nr:hypothetical protein [Methanococcus maripaludis]MBA2864915.1 hypothetical protein [Methanococcus maripaludis]